MRPLTAEVAGAGISLLPALASLRSSQLARYHGAEHKAIGGYERGTDAEEQSTEHERCGSHLVAPMLAATVAGNALVSRLPAARRGPRPAGRQLRRGRRSRPRPSGGSSAIATAAVAQMMLRPGFALQRSAATREPTAEELEVARTALDEVLRLEDSGGRP